MGIEEDTDDLRSLIDGSPQLESDAADFCGKDEDDIAEYGFRDRSEDSRGDFAKLRRMPEKSNDDGSF